MSSADGAVFITDVTLRDGLQSETTLIPTPKKIELFRKIWNCGFDRLEITSFVHPKWIPQLADGEAFCQEVFKAGKPSGCELMAFVPNEKGLERLLKFPIEWASVFVAATEVFNHKNVNSSVTETISNIHRVVSKAHAESRKVRVYLSTAFGCPYEGKVPTDRVVDVLKQIVETNPDEIALSDTIGVGLPEQVGILSEKLAEFYPISKVALHAHDTYGLALGNIMAGWASGIRKFDGSLGGVGGCPYAKGATGNVASESIFYAFERKGLKKGGWPQIREAIETLKGAGLETPGPIAQVLLKGGTLYGVG